jgi:tetratricopeptide (TPR) repeat protein
MSRTVTISVLLVAAILLIYSQTAGFGFVNYDDDVYVYNNPHVQQGITAESLRWALTAVVSNNWMPLTLISHLLDVQLFGLASGMHHLVNVLFHALATLLLYLILLRTTRAPWPSALVALVFAVHPLHVGSVAWIAERKDVLSAFLFFLALYAYLRYTECPGGRRLLVVTGIFGLGLMAKPMLVTFPFVLLLIDFWPLRRLAWPKAVVEKLPLFALSAAASVITYRVQQGSGAVNPIGFGARVQNALVSYGVYVGQTVWPVDLAVFYPFPQAIPVWQIAAAAVLLAAVTTAVLAWRATQPYLAVGWFWFLGMLVPVIGLIQAGDQSHADRYMYLPMVGLAVMAAFSGAEAIRRSPRLRTPLVAAAALYCAGYLGCAVHETSYWRNGETLFSRALEVTSHNWLAHYNLAHYLMDQPGRTPEAIPHLQAALRIKPDDADIPNNLGACLLDLGRPAEAVPYFETLVKMRPDSADARFNLALALSKTPGREDEAMAQYEAALRIEPRHSQAHHNLGLMLAKRNRTEEALTHLRTAAKLKPDYADEYNLGVVLLNAPGREAEALEHLEAAQRLHPDPQVANTIAQLRQRLSPPNR